MDDLDIDETPQGREWKAVSLKALDQPVPLSLPINIQGQFLADRSRAIGLEFQVRQGEHLDFELIKSRSGDFIIYADLYKKRSSKEKSS